ncbi:MAG: SDR family oxidoreductase [bacterium]|nr:SDR family oxidoreductase [bacterium]MCY4258272.1 SDR family oxidoreductase [bacterium]
MTNLTPANLFNLTDKVALVTGGGRGVGAMFSEGLLGAGARVIICSRRQQQLDEAVERLSGLGPVEAIAADLSSEQGCQQVVDELNKRCDRLDILVNNSGASWGAPLEEFPDTAWSRVLDLNVKAVFQLTVGLLPLLQASASADDPARVINIGSVQGLQAPEMENYSYSTSKAAVHHLTRVLAKKLAPQHITVNCVAPGFFPSKMTAKTLEDHGDQVIADTPLRRVGTPEDMAGVLMFLAGRAGAFCTGTVIPVDGGYATTL